MTMNDQQYAQYASYQQNQQVQQAANDRATQAYNSSKLAGESEDRALQRAQFEWKKTYEEANLTGKYQGDWTQPVRQWQAETFGTWGAPTAGQQTQAAQQQQFTQGQNLAAMYGQYYAPGQAPTAGMQTQTAQEQAYTQWLRATQEQRAQEQLRQDTANRYLTLLSGMRGPQNYFQYQNVLGSTPQGMRDLVGAAMGAYVPGGGATTGVQPVAQSLQGLYGDVTGGPTNVNAFTPGGAGYQPATGGGTNQAANALGGGTNTMGAGQAQAQQLNLPAPNQVAMQSWNNLAPSQQQLMTSGWEATGWNADDVKALMSQSLPKYGTNAATAGTWRLR